jgi:FixJ family two-component response regulator
MVIPGASGEEVVEAFRETHPDSAIVVISGYSDKLNKGMWDPGEVEFLRKPFSAVDLVDAIRRATGE